VKAVIVGQIFPSSLLAKQSKHKIACQELYGTKIYGGFFEFTSIDYQLCKKICVLIYFLKIFYKTSKRISIKT